MAEVRNPSATPLLRVRTECAGQESCRVGGTEAHEQSCRVRQGRSYLTYEEPGTGQPFQRQPNLRCPLT